MSATNVKLGTTIWDSLVFFAVGLGILVIGLWNWIYPLLLPFCKRKKDTKKKTMAEHTKGASTFHWITSSLSLLASTLSGHLLVRYPTFIYFYGPVYWIAGLHIAASIALCNWIVVPLFMRLQLTTVMEYLEKRFDKKVLYIAFAFQMADSLLAASFWLKIPLNTLAQLLGYSQTATLIVSAVLVVVYSAFGGMSAIVKVDFINLMVIAVANVLMVAKGIIILGGFRQVFAVNSHQGRTFFDPNPDPFTDKSTSASIFLGYLNFGIMTYGFSQSTYDKYQPSGQTRVAKWMLWAQIPYMMAFYTLSLFMGMNMFGYYEGCDPFLNKRAFNKEELIPTFVRDIAKARKIVAIVGLFSASFLSGALSGVASNLNGVTSIVNEHFVRGSKKWKQWIEYLQGFHFKLGFMAPILLSLTTSVPLMIVAVIIAIYDSQMKGMFTSPVTLMNILEAPILGVYLLGFFNRRATPKAALLGILAGSLFGVFFLCLHFQYPDPNCSGPDIPEAASVEFCKEYYCQSVHNVTTDCEVPVTNCKPKNLLNIYPKLAYGLGGFVVVLITFVVGSSLSHLEVMKKEDLEKNTNLLAEVYLFKKRIFPTKSVKLH